MPFKVTIKNASNDEAEHHFQTDEPILVEITSCGRNTWRESTLSALSPGDHVRLSSSKTSACSEVVSIEEV